MSETNTQMEDPPAPTPTAVEIATGAAVAGAVTGDAASKSGQGITSSIVTGLEAAATTVVTDIPSTIAAMGARLAALETKVAAYEQAHPAIAALIGVLGKFFPNDIKPLASLLNA